MNITGVKAKKYYVMHVTNRARVKPHPDLSRLVAILYRGPRAISPPLEFTAPSVIDILRDERICEPQSNSSKKSICERKICCDTCGTLTRDLKHDCSKRYCKSCEQNKATGHLCFKSPLKDVLPANANNVLYLFYDFEITQNKRYCDTAKNMCLNSCACNSFVQDVRKSKTVVLIGNDVPGGGTLFAMIL